MEESDRVDIDMCLIFIDRLSNPHLDPISREGLFKELKDASKHDELRNLVESAKANIFGIRDTFRIKARELNGETTEEIIDSSTYINALKILIDPNIKDGEFKPNFKILMEGKLTDDQQQQAKIIMHCTDQKQRETMMDDFKKSFKPQPKKKVEKVVTEKPASSGEGSVPALELEGDLRSLISRLIDPKVKREKKTDIYLKLMESKDADYKNVAIQLIDPSNKKRLEEIVKEFDQMLEGKKQRELRESKAKKEAEELQKKILREKREKLEKKKQEMMKKRKLTLEMRAEQRRKETESGQLMTQEEKDTYRRLEREKVMEMIKRNREADKNAPKKNINESKTGTQDDRNRISFVIIPWTRELSELPDVSLEIQDMNKSQDLDERGKQELEKLLNPFRANKSKNDETNEGEDKPTQEDVSSKPENNAEESKPAVEKKEELTSDTPSRNEPKPTPESEHKPEPEPEPEPELPEFVEYFIKFNKPDLDDTEETDIIKELIKGRKTDLLKQLIVRLSTIKGVGKSKMFGILCTKFVGQRVYSETPANNEDSATNGKQDKEVNNKSVEDTAKDSNMESKDDEKENKVLGNKPVVDADNNEKLVVSELKNTEELSKTGLTETSVKGDENDKKSLETEELKSNQEDDNSKMVEPTENNQIKDNDVKKPTISNKDAENPAKTEDSSLIENKTKDAELTSNDPSDQISDINTTKVDSSIENNTIEKADTTTKDVPEEIKAGSKRSNRSSKSIDDNNKEKSKKVNGNIKDAKNETKVPEPEKEPASVKKAKRTPSKKFDQLEKNILKMSMAEVRDHFKLKRIHSYVKIKRNKNLHVAYLAQQRRLSDNDSTSEQSPVRKRKGGPGPEQHKVPKSKRQKVVVNPLFALNENTADDMITTGTNDDVVKENGVSDSDSNIASTSSITASITHIVKRNADDDSQSSSKKAVVDIKDTSNDNDKIIVNGDSSKRKRSFSRSRSRSRSRSKSLSRSRPKSLSRSRSKSISRSRSKSLSRSRSKSISRSRSKSISRSRSKSISRSRSKSLSRSRTKSRSKSISRSRSKSISRSRSRSRSKSLSRSGSRSKS